MKRDIERRKINGLRRGLIQGGVALILAIGILLETPPLTLAQTTLAAVDTYGDGSARVLNRGATLAAGLAHSCAVLADGGVQCWSDNVFDKPGGGTRPDSLVPLTVSGITNAVAVAGSCAVLADGRVQCWSVNSFDKPGSVARPDSLVPVTVSGITNAVAVAGSCAVLADGRVQCWGHKSSVPVTVSLTKAVAVVDGAAQSGE
jgi:hypothetical protein